MSALFTPYRVGSLELRNRIVIAPMCQYSADEGRATDWHVIHLGHLALSGAALLIIEATAVTPEGRISPDDLGLWSDETEAALGRVLEIVRRYSDMPIAIQLAHAGPQGLDRACRGRAAGRSAPGEPHGWQTVAPSALPFADGRAPAGRAGPRRGWQRVRDAFADAARAGRAARARRGPDPRRARLPAAPVPLAAVATGETTTTAAASRTGCAFRSRCSTRCARRSRRSGR